MFINRAKGFVVEVPVPYQVKNMKSKTGTLCQSLEYNLETLRRVSKRNLIFIIDAPIWSLPKGKPK